MNKVMMMALALVIAPGVSLAQQVPQPLPRPVPLPGTDSLGVPPVVLLVPGSGPAGAMVAGALEGAAAGAVYAASLGLRRPDCASAVTPGERVVWGGLRGLLGRRQARVRTVLVNERVPRVAPRPDPNRRTPQVSVSDERCVAFSPNVASGDTR